MNTDELRRRTLQFGIRGIKLAEAVPVKNATSAVLTRQLIRGGTSVGSNYRTAIRARSRNESIAKLGLVEEECDETMYWFEIIRELGMVKENLLTDISRKANELLAITITSIKTARSNARKPFKK